MGLCTTLRSTSGTKSPVPLRSQDASIWPIEVAALYSRKKFLGRGKFGDVWEATPIESSPQSSVGKHFRGEDDVAIKFVDMSTEGKRTCAIREATILSQLPTHPCVCSLILSIPAPSANTQALVLRFSRGPTLQNLLTKGGALGLPLAKIVAKDLIRAVGFLHGRGVLHRDIKPDNCIVTGTEIEKDCCWMDSYHGDACLVLVEVGDDVGLNKLAGELRKEATAERNRQTTTWVIRETNGRSEINSPLNEDIRTEHGANDYISAGKPRKGSNIPTIRRSFVNRVPSSGRNSGNRLSNSGRNSGRSSLRDSLHGLSSSGHRDSISYNDIMDLSAVGSRAFAAPELVRGVKKNKSDVGYFGTTGLGKASGALTTYVSSYGMVADAYSVGAIIREVFFGVPPRCAINNYVQMKRTPLVRATHAYKCMRAQRKGQQKPILRPNLRETNKVPKEVIALVDALICPNHRSRMTVRAALGTPWLMNEKEDGPCDPKKWTERRGSASGREIEYLPCALESMSFSKDGTKGYKYKRTLIPANEKESKDVQG